MACNVEGRSKEKGEEGDSEKGRKELHNLINPIVSG